MFKKIPDQLQKAVFLQFPVLLKTGIHKQGSQDRKITRHPFIHDMRNPDYSAHSFFARASKLLRELNYTILRQGLEEQAQVKN